MENKNLLSCDGLDDALRSLALVYGVEKSSILQMYKNNWPDFLPEYDGLLAIKLDYFNDLMGEYLGVKNFECPSIQVAFYHRARFDGTSTWFRDGLLDSVSGAKIFIEKVRGILEPHFDVDKLSGAIISNIENRTQLEGKAIGGPYAFDWYDAAVNASGYDVPEFLCGTFSDGKGGKIYFLKDVADLLLESLSPVIIKFLDFPRDHLTYVNGLWEYVYRKRFDYEISQQTGRCSFTANGKKIASENLIGFFTDF